jgi:tetratricopeptide (TPR) repeat protein
MSPTKEQRTQASESQVRIRPSAVAAGTAPLVAILIIVYAAALGLSVYLARNGQYQIGVGGAILVLTMAPIAFAFALGGSRAQQRLLNERVDELSRHVRAFTDYAALSEDARRVLSRGNDKVILTQAIEEDIANANWDAAMVLVKELAERFGYRADAEEFRRKIDAARAETIAQEITEAIQYLDGLIVQRRWDAAFADAARLLRLYPDSTRVFGLRGRVEQAQRSYKEELERRFLVAAKDGRNDEAMLLVKELDGYLSPTEAEPLRELARGVIGKARENLGAQFKLAVQDKNWREASRVGERIIADFPNSRMAAEIRDVIDGIRIRANSM